MLRESLTCAPKKGFGFVVFSMAILLCLHASNLRADSPIYTTVKVRLAKYFDNPTIITLTGPDLNLVADQKHPSVEVDWKVQEGVDYPCQLVSDHVGGHSQLTVGDFVNW